MTTTPPTKPGAVLSAEQVADIQVRAKREGEWYDPLESLCRSVEELRRQLAEAEARAEAYEIACEELEQNQERRVKADRAPGCQGSLVDGLSSLFLLLDERDDRIATLERQLAEAEQERDDLRRHQDTFRVLARLELNHDALEKEAADATGHLKRLVAERDTAVRERDEAIAARRKQEKTTDREVVACAGCLSASGINELHTCDDSRESGPTVLAEHDKDKSTSGAQVAGVGGAAETGASAGSEARGDAGLNSPDPVRVRAPEPPLVEQTQPGAENGK